MTKEDIIRYLRNSVYISMEGVEDTEYLSMSDEDLEDYLIVALSRDFPQYSSLDNLPNSCLYPLILLTKKDLYHTLAVKESPSIDMGADNNNYLKESQRFDHYMKLISQVDKEYQDYLDDGGAGNNTVNSYSAVLPNRYNTRWNYENGNVPAPFIFKDWVTDTAVACHWEASFSRFKEYELFVSKESLLGKLRQNLPVEDSVEASVKIRDIHRTYSELKGLTPDTDYYITVKAVELSGTKGFAEMKVHTLGGQ